MQNSTALAVAAAAASAALLSPLLARLVLTVPDASDARWWRARSAPSAGLRRATALVAVGFGALAGAAAGWGPALPAFWLLALSMAVLAVVDARTHRLPDRLALGAAAAVPALLAAATLGRADRGDLVRALLAGAAAFAGLCALRLISPSGLGFGDVKVGAVLGAALGWQRWSAVPAGIFAGFLIGGVVALLLMGAGRAGLRTAIPFGPSLILGALLVCAAAGPPA